MLRLSKLTDYAVVVLIRLAQGDAVQTAPGIALATGVPEPTVAKVLKLLAGASLVGSTRGARGGYSLRKPLNGISVGSVIAAIDGPIALTACVDGAGSCEVQQLCPVRGRWDLVNNVIRSALDNVTLDELRMAAIPPALRLPMGAEATAAPVATQAAAE